MQNLKDFFSSTANCIAFATATSLGAVSSYYLWRSYKLRIPEHFERLGRIEKVIIYPIKSLPGVEVESAEVTKLGLQYGPFRDRSFLLLKPESGIMISMRQEPTLALLKLSLQGDYLCINGHEMKPLMIQLKNSVSPEDNIRTCRLYGQDVCGIDCGDEVAEWFSKYLGKPDFRLVQYVPEFEPRKLITNLVQQYNPGSMLYHDDCAYLFLSEASIEDLNKHSAVEKFTFKFFRPNFLISGCKAFAEDNMKIGKIGEAVFLFMSQCPRCILTTVNPETGVKTEKEPLTTLRTYRLAQGEKLKKQYGNSPLFGVYMGTRKEGIVSVGDYCLSSPF